MSSTAEGTKQTTKNTGREAGCRPAASGTRRAEPLPLTLFPFAILGPLSVVFHPHVHEPHGIRIEVSVSENIRAL